MKEFVFSELQHGGLLSEASVANMQIALLARRIPDFSGDVDLLDALSAAIVVMAGRNCWLMQLAETGTGQPTDALDQAQYWLIPEACRPDARVVEGRVAQ